jgi:hypothetical protein
VISFLCLVDDERNMERVGAVTRYVIRTEEGSKLGGRQSRADASKLISLEPVGEGADVVTRSFNR